MAKIDFVFQAVTDRFHAGELHRLLSKNACHMGVDFLARPCCCPLLSLRGTKKGLRKPRMEVIVSTFREKRLGSSQPIVAARLVLIRTLHNSKPASLSIP
jgi:hypothetical protein